MLTDTKKYKLRVTKGESGAGEGGRVKLGVWAWQIQASVYKLDQ